MTLALKTSKQLRPRREQLKMRINKNAFQDSFRTSNHGSKARLLESVEPQSCVLWAFLSVVRATDKNAVILTSNGQRISVYVKKNRTICKKATKSHIIAHFGWGGKVLLQFMEIQLKVCLLVVKSYSSGRITQLVFLKKGTLKFHESFGELHFSEFWRNSWKKGLLGLNRFAYFHGSLGERDGR